MIIDEKSMSLQPPPYIASAPPPFPLHQHRLGTPTLAALPSHLLLHVVYMTFPQTHGIDQHKIERQRKTLYWLANGLRLVNRSFYIACMHVLRSTYLPAYDSLIRPPYTSDPFPLLPPSSSPTTSTSSPTVPSYSSSQLSSSSSPSSTDQQSIKTLQRETSTLDLFIALKVREDVWADDSELHLEREESFKDLFDLNQPRSRLEDLVRGYGVRDGVISISSSSGIPGTPTPRSSGSGSKQLQPAIPFTLLSISFSPRKIGLQLLVQGRRRTTIVEVARASRDERLEVGAKRIVRELSAWMRGGQGVGYGYGKGLGMYR